MSTLAATATSLRGQAVAPIPWRRVLGYGVSFGVAAAAMESFALPLGDTEAAELLIFVLQLALQWCISGTLLAGATIWLDRWLTPWRAVVLVLGFASLECLVTVIVQPFDSYITDLPRDGSLAHTFWGGLFYGGLFVAAYKLNQRSQHTRAVLGRAEIARQQAEALFNTSRLRALQGQVDPVFLLRVMRETEHRYAHDAAGVDRLLDALVNFLRAAMPAVRSGASTLQAEVRLAALYARVWAELDPGRPSWQVDVDAQVPDLPFAPLLLLPLLERLAGAGGPGPAAELRLQVHGRRCVLTLLRAAPQQGPWLGDELRYRLQIGLRSHFGDAWQLDEHDDTAAQGLRIVLPIDPAAHATRDSPRSPTTTQETSHE